MSIKILKVTKIETENTCLEVEIEIDGEFKRECFVGYAEWIHEENGEKKFITQSKKIHLKSKEEKLKIFKEDQEQKEKKTELKEYKNKVIA